MAFNVYELRVTIKEKLVSVNTKLPLRDRFGPYQESNFRAP